jgi:hypothetical protein
VETEFQITEQEQKNGAMYMLSVEGLYWEGECVLAKFSVSTRLFELRSAEAISFAPL